MLAPHVADADIVITTAAGPGRRAPILITGPMVEAMRSGSVVVELAAESGGNVEDVVAGESVQTGGAVVVGLQDVPSRLPVDASRLYARNVSDLALLMVADGELTLDFDDEIVAGACLTHDGRIRHAPTAEAMGES